MPTLYWSPLPKPRALPCNLCGLLLPVHTLLLRCPGLGGWGSCPQLSWGLASSIARVVPWGRFFVSQANIFLRVLDISYNGCGDSGASAVGEALKTNNVLEELYMR